ncbi:hypothetical protein GCM10022254_18580 [Actinomadura meridiana]|uniref:HTH cro/C1-type domain-containing protein n=1 Tax=Actinomadura meridiana TaxID=559626 RepID=A0ABP8BWI3_9ACTN
MTHRQDRSHSPILRSRRLALELTRRREAAGMSRDEVTRRLEWANSTLFRIETARTRPLPRSVREMLDLYGVTGAEKEGLIQLAREARKRSAPGVTTGSRACARCHGDAPPRGGGSTEVVPPVVGGFHLVPKTPVAVLANLEGLS